MRRFLQQLSRRQIANQPPVGCEELVVCQLFELGPAHLVEDAVVDFAGELVHRKELQVDCAAVTVVVANADDARADNCLDAELFIQLPRKCLLGAFPRLDLAAGKLPLQGHGLVWAALPDQHLPGAQNESGRHKAKGGT